MASHKTLEKDYYAILDVPPDASARLIKENHRLMVQRYHPDLYKVPEEAEAATRRMAEINEAYAVLSDKKRRAEYDVRKKAAAVPSSAPTSTPKPKVDWEATKTPSVPKAAASNPALDEAVAEEFLESLRKLVSHRGSAMKLREENEKPWLWSFSGGTWSKSCWVSLARLPELNVNPLRTILTQCAHIVGKRGSGWKDSFFVFVLATESISDGENTLKLCRSYCNEKENSTRGRLVNIVILDLKRRRSIVCGKRPADSHQQALLDTLVS